MLNRTSFVVLVISSIVLSACYGPVAQGGMPSTPNQGSAGSLASGGQPSAAQPGQIVPVMVEVTPITGSTAANSNADHHSEVDLTHLEVGDGKYSTSPQSGYVYTCMTSFGGAGGAGTAGNWINNDGTWDATKKAVVDGSVSWPSSFTVSLQGDQRVFAGNDLPDHPTGNFPIAPGDDAYTYDRNPNSIQQQSITLTLPANPTAAAQPNCVGGEVGIMLSGVVIFSAFDAEGRDAPAHEVQDHCNGHPQVSGFYHYHNLSDCIVDNATGHSALMGYAFDGYGIYGYYGEDGKELTNADLDACHGHTHTIEWNGQMVSMYHYHATHEFPYVVGCFHGTPAVRALSTGEAQRAAPQSGQVQSTQGQGGGPRNGQQPPQAALDACLNLAVNAACTVNTPGGEIHGTCLVLQNSITACVPANGPP